MKPTDINALLEGLATSPDLCPFEELIASLEAHDREHNSDLVRTLKVFFAANANVSETADRLLLHRNSIPYRLERIGELTGLNLKDYRVRLALQLGLLASSKERRKTMKLSTRNRLPGTITEVTKGEVAAQVSLRVGDNHMVALITHEGVEELGLEVGQEVTVLVKATDVVILTAEGSVA